MEMKIKKEDKDLNYWKKNCEEDYLHTPISVLRYITKLESQVNNVVSDDVSNCELDKIEKAISSLKKVHGKIVKRYYPHNATQAFKFEDDVVYNVRISRNTNKATLD